jgi:hypothetical protein
MIAGLPFSNQPKKAISLSGIVITTEMVISTHNNNTTDKIFSAGGNDLHIVIIVLLGQQTLNTGISRSSAT